MPNVKSNEPIEPHVHADLIHLWAEGTLIQIQDQHNKWMLDKDPTWDPKRNYRVVPDTLALGESTYPRPIEVAPERGAYVYTPCVANTEFVDRHTWKGDAHDIKMLERAMVHLDADNAAEHCRALIRECGGKVF